MKRLLALAILIAAASSLALVRSSSKPVMPNQDAVIAQEKLILDALKKKDAKAFDGVVASDAILFGSQGRLPISEFKKVVFGPDYSFDSGTIEDAQVMMIDQDAALLTYKSTGTQTFKGQSHTETGYASTVWAKRGGKWVAIFHQESMSAPAGGQQ